MNILFFLLFACVSTLTWGRAIIDKDVLPTVMSSKPSSLKIMNLMASLPTSTQNQYIPILVFLASQDHMDDFLAHMQQIPDIRIEALHFMPAVFLIIPNNKDLLNRIAQDPFATHISSLKTAGEEELENSTQSILLQSSPTYPKIQNWWDQQYTGQQGVVGLIDSGVAIEHPGLAGKDILVRAEPGSTFDQYKNSVRTAHATGVACIYTSPGSGQHEQERGVAYGAKTIVSALAGDGETPDEFLLTVSSLDWMLSRASVRPTVINYSIGNGSAGCATCSDWSGLAKIVDYVVNHEKILWVKSAGNDGYVTPSPHSPFNTTMTVPADNYNALTVANMNPSIVQDGVMIPSSNRQSHAIRYTSSRGPTLLGRKKPDLSAPGHDTRTCAPDPQQYSFNYATTMDYHDGYRLMGGTSSAAPHVGGAILLLQDAGIQHPMAAKALLINSADAWTDSSTSGPDDPHYPYKGGHYPVMGSEWNRTYGWGYLNMQKAFDQRENVIEDALSVKNNVKTYEVFLPVGGKVTLVHERRVGFMPDNSDWRLSHLSLELYDFNTNELIARDDSAIDTVHQVAHCQRAPGAAVCSNENTGLLHVLVRVTLQSDVIDGEDNEPFALSFG